MLSLTDQAHQQLRRDVLTCRLRPGESLSEASAALRLGLGKAPVRAALARLAEEGLIQAMPRRGWSVSPVTVRDIHEVFDLRLLLEPEAARRAAGRMGACALRRLDALRAHGRPPDDLDGTPHVLAANKAFHVAVAELSGNGRLARQIDRLLDESARMLFLSLLHQDRAAETSRGHHDLIEALTRGKSSEAATLMWERVAVSRDAVLAALTAPDAAMAVS